MPGEYEIILEKCKCGRVKRNGVWVHPIKEDLRQIEDNYYRIKFAIEQCTYCKDRRKF
jgi:hypothetical protein